MNCRIELRTETKLVGKSLTMSFENNNTVALWKTFMPGRKLISKSKTSDLYSLEIYPRGFFDEFNPSREFQKWAAVEVADEVSIPDGMHSLIIPGGLYAVFVHKGPASEGPKTYSFIFNEWLPGSGYRLDERPHFALMGEKYKNNDPDSEEEIWIPVVPATTASF